MIWTGDAAIVWGGNDGSTQLDSGGFYDPWTDSWEPTPATMDVPAGRTRHTAVWAGEEMLIWGGCETEPNCTNHELATGARLRAVPDGSTCDTGMPACQCLLDGSRVCVAGSCVNLGPGDGDDEDGDGVSDSAFDSLRLHIAPGPVLVLSWLEPAVFPDGELRGYRVWRRDLPTSPWAIIAETGETSYAIPLVSQEVDQVFKITAIVDDQAVP